MNCAFPPSLTPVSPLTFYWTGLLSLHFEGQEALLPHDFLHRLNLNNKMEQALNNGAPELNDKKLDRTQSDTLVAELKADFLDLAILYDLSLVEGFRIHVTMITNNVLL